ncbi:hypothetical protein N7495_008452 [Penicillium taxi]|uniref:uncharacterized protein n=1 Tax=Penicillium taxi TaxID=168475 RepID=UPI002544DB81|nr:uncharacterized protein N7495_008452 [Penicillium taxi]KAJ5888411.1 hypothetical protein N7495_008452 [Penicillium taxi]
MPLQTMPIQTSPPSFPDSFPSFMSVYGQYKEEESSFHSLLPSHVVNPRRLLPSHRKSVSSMTSVSTESSPTNTVSPFDSPLTSEITPSSSPESPSAMPLSYPKFPPPSRALDITPRPMMPPDNARLVPTPLEARPTSPGSRARNLKNLSLRMPPSSRGRPPIATASVAESSKKTLSCPPSPIQIPQQSIRRRPANLSIRTPGINKSFTTNGSDIVPPTPLLNQHHSLRHSESSPSLASISSPAFGPPGGLHFPPIRSRRGTHNSVSSSEETHSPLTSMPEDGIVVSHRIIQEKDENDVHMDSRESTRKADRGYPDGPIRIHDSGVFLYLEPTAEEASKFDVVFNVAKEVANPFSTDQKEQPDTVMSTWRNAPRASNPFSKDSPLTAMSELSFKSAFDFQPESESTTPAPSTPEYIHVSWDHNSEILDDLLPLCELIDDRISQGKRVLVHCQLGASRSASLVIAYGLYKNRHLDFNAMYEIVKGRSQWVGPNMSLIYQLTDFRGRLLRGSPSRPAPEEWFMDSPRRSSEPQTSLEERAAREESAYSTGLPPVSCLAPPSMPGRPRTSGTGARSPKRSLSPRPLPFRQKFPSLEPSLEPTSGRPRKLPRSVSSTCAPVVQTRVVMRNFSANAGLFSPRTGGFLTPAQPVTSSPPRAPTIESVVEVPNAVQYATETADPRSPPVGGTEKLMMRNIFDFL